MSADDPTGRKQQESQADRTLLGVAPPKLESSPDSKLHSPVFVRSGTVGAEGDQPLPLPRMALPSRPAASSSPEVPAPAPALPSSRKSGSSRRSKPAFGASAASSAGSRSGLAQLLRARPLLWMVALPAAIAALVIGAIALTGAPPQATVAPGSATASVNAIAPSAAPGQKISLAELAALEGKAPESLTARELVQLAEGRAAREREAARSLREQLAANGDLANDRATQAKLLALAQQSDTAGDALLALSVLQGPLGPDLLYEVWTGTSARTEATELARVLLYSADVRPRASKALSVALDLRVADTCEKNRDVLPRALADGDKRSLHLLVKLQNKRGCGPKKLNDCFACLRARKAQLASAVNAVKARRAPSYPTP